MLAILLIKIYLSFYIVGFYLKFETYLKMIIIFGWMFRL